jgi:hypothetical protein
MSRVESSELSSHESFLSSPIPGHRGVAHARARRTLADQLRPPPHRHAGVHSSSERSNLGRRSCPVAHARRCIQDRPTGAVVRPAVAPARHPPRPAPAGCVQRGSAQWPSGWRPLDSSTPAPSQPQPLLPPAIVSAVCGKCKITSTQLFFAIQFNYYLPLQKKKTMRDNEWKYCIDFSKKRRENCISCSSKSCIYVRSYLL